MIKILKKIPNPVVVAVSGGPDSMAVLDFVRKGHRQTFALFIHHGTQASCLGQDVVCDFCNSCRIGLRQYFIGGIPKPKGKSWEEHWRHERYNIFHNVDMPVITAHHLDDVLETWIFTSCHGKPEIIPYQNENVIRPFLLNKKEELRSWVERKKIPFTLDDSNNDPRYMRNYIRQSMVESYRHVNPGVDKTMRKLILAHNQGEDHGQSRPEEKQIPDVSQTARDQEG